MGNDGLCSRCGEIEPHGMDCHCPTEPCFALAQPAPSRCPVCGYIAGVNCERRDSHNKPAPAQLPEEVAADLEEVTNVLRKVQEVLRNEDLLFAAEGLRSVFHVLSRHADLTRRLAEAEAGNGRFADMLESSVADWRKLYAEERAERVRIEGILLNDVQDERQESDEHIKGLVTVIKTQDKNIGDLKAHIQRIGVDHDDVEARAEAAEARLAEVESSVGVVQYRRLEAQLHEAEARVLEMERFARHSDDCELVQPRGVHIPYCTCGLKAALAATEVPNA